MIRIQENDNLRTLWDHLACSRGEHPFLEYQSKLGIRRAFTYAEFNRYINKTANCLLSLGVRPGQNVAVQLYNSPEYISITCALAKIGAVAVPLNMQYKLEECVYVFEACDITCVIAEPDCQYYYIDEATEPQRDYCGELCVGEKPYTLPQVLIVHAAGEVLYGAALDFDAAVAACPDELADVYTPDALDTCMIMFTSGTTSCPKGVELTHANMIFGGKYGVWQCALGPDDRLLTTMPAFHSNFQTAALMPVLVAGATLIFLEKYSARSYWKSVREYRATAIQLVAMMARTMMMQPVDADEQNHCVHSVQYYLAISDEEHAAFEARFGVRLQNCYGSTESVCWVLTDATVGERRWPSVGKPGPGYDVEIWQDDTRADVGEIGDIMVRGVAGVSLMKGYYRDSAATAHALRADGWYFTGDKGYCDADGWFYFVDRKCNMIKRAGENVSATEVEDVLMEHPAVAEAAVIGVCDPIRDQAVKAFVVPQQGQEVSVDELLAYCTCRLANFKVPSIVEVVEELPHTSVGKIAKKLLQ